jgi:hypothetical protein
VRQKQKPWLPVTGLQHSTHSTVCINVPSLPTIQIHGHQRFTTHVATMHLFWLAGFRCLVVEKGTCTPCKCMSFSLTQNGCHCSDGILAVASIACRFCSISACTSIHLISICPSKQTSCFDYKAPPSHAVLLAASQCALFAKTRSNEMCKELR